MTATYNIGYERKHHVHKLEIFQRLPSSEFLCTLITTIISVENSLPTNPKNCPRNSCVYERETQTYTYVAVYEYS